MQQCNIIILQFLLYPIRHIFDTVKSFQKHQLAVLGKSNQQLNEYYILL
jgi:hypothetical protein